MLANHRVLITGANGGMSISIIETLLKNNANLVLLYNKNRNEIDKFLTDNKNFQPHVEIYQVDLLDSKQLNNTLKKILDIATIDTFVHSVTLPVLNQAVTQLKWDDYQLHIELQTKSYLEIIQSLLPGMKEKNQGKIISILTSYTVGSPPNKISNYIVGKYSLLGLSKALAVELGPFGITVNCISPSMTDTPLIRNLPSKLKEITANQVPLKRLAKPQDVASTVLFLCSKYADYINGENMLVTGGQTMH